MLDNGKSMEYVEYRLISVGDSLHGWFKGFLTYPLKEEDVVFYILISGKEKYFLRENKGLKQYFVGLKVGDFIEIEVERSYFNKDQERVFEYKAYKEPLREAVFSSIIQV